MLQHLQSLLSELYDIEQHLDVLDYLVTDNRFLAAVEPSAAGDHEATCDVSFAMCTEENCVLEQRTVAMQLKVE